MESKNYELAFWSKFSIILFISNVSINYSVCSFKYKISKHGQRIFIGILTGVSLFLFNQTINKLSMIINIPPFLDHSCQY